MEKPKVCYEDSLGRETTFTTGQGKVRTDIENLYCGGRWPGGHCEQVDQRNVNNDKNDSKLKVL